MLRNLSILLAAGVVVALPFVFRRPGPETDWRPGDPVLVVITPHNEAIRYEFGRAFSAWHQERHGQPVRIDWRAIGGTTEIMRYLVSEYVAAVRAWRTGAGKPWPAGTGDAMVDRRFDTERGPEDGAARRAWEIQRDVFLAFRATDDPEAFTSKIDLFFGGGTYDHTAAAQQGLTVAPWPAGDPPPGLFSSNGVTLIPEGISGETWRTPTVFGNVVSTFGICYNLDRLRDLGLRDPPSQWRDLAGPAYFRQVGVADPTKSGSIAKAFEMIVQQACHEAVYAAGFTRDDIDRFEERIARGVRDDAPVPYREAIRTGWMEGMRLVQRIGANARYFTDSSSKIPIDVSMGDAAAGLVIDFYGRYQAQCSRAPDGTERMLYVTPVGGSSVSADPISLLRGAEHREVAVRFIRFVLSEEGQRLWTYRPGTPGGPERFALRRLPIRRDFYPSPDPALEAAHLRHARYAADDLADPTVDPYALATTFTYRPRWTGQHFGVQRDLVKAMCLDAADELRAAWRAILEHGGPDAQAAAVERLGRLPDVPEPVTWDSAPGMTKKYGRMECLTAWTDFFRKNYGQVREMVE